ncbi:uncharacterized protein LOC120457614 isoform X3 [Drosophila santomea]|uniref:uncharacterized protein LOC120457614 isoform X3 n=1 Tax=Drosophila santomea TaxID=129105 RepID=UPI0019531C26|nr:uncharacterized protein LOC120457614 isoform X3 [Drosophila santomea]
MGRFNFADLSVVYKSCQVRPQGVAGSQVGSDLDNIRTIRRSRRIIQIMVAGGGSPVDGV